MPNMFLIACERDRLYLCGAKAKRGCADALLCPQAVQAAAWGDRSELTMPGLRYHGSYIGILERWLIFTCRRNYAHDCYAHTTRRRAILIKPLPSLQRQRSASDAWGYES
jgi:hypothetical protein